MSITRKAIIPILFFCVVMAQYFYDTQKVSGPALSFPISPAFLKSFDLGLHSALASFLWIDTRTELPFFQQGPQKFFADLDTINKLDPKFSTPYAFTVLVLPNTKYPDRINASVEIGRRGVEEADKDWRVPLYLATIYHLYLKDETNTAKYFDIAARTPGIPEIVQRFAINYGVLPSLREKTKAVWIAIYNTSEDKFTKERARAYVVHYEILDFLDSAVKSYKERYGKYPAEIKDLLDKKIITSIPPDPFGLEFAMYDDGVVGIKQLPNQQ
jgi:hypothetical protein